MAVVVDEKRSNQERLHSTLRRPGRSIRQRVRNILLINLVTFSFTFAAAEAGLRLFSTSKYWVHTHSLVVGAGQTRAGKKWWPNTTYLVESSEFQQEFRTDARGYRARSGAIPATHAYRIAFVGDSFTEGMQVANDATFCARIESLLNEGNPVPPVVCENYGISATDLFDYWHRIVHDVLPSNAPDALVLCIYPGNDFLCVFPDDGFDGEGRPLAEYFQGPGWEKHLIAWINLHSKFGSYLQRAIFSIGAQREPWLAQGPKNWWTDPRIALQAENSPAVRRSRALFQAIEEACRQKGTKLCILIVGPVAGYRALEGQSPLAKILAGWKIDAPVIDVAIRARARPDWPKLVFSCDGHLNEAGHADVANETAPELCAALFASAQGRKRP